MKSLPLLHLSLLVSLLFSHLPIAAQENKEAKVTDPDEPHKTEKQIPVPQIGMLIEYFELDHREANRLLRQFAPKASRVDELRTVLGDMIRKGDATLVETVWLRSLSGQRALTQSIEEHIYSTEWDPPEIPNTLGAVIPAKKTTGPQPGSVQAQSTQPEPFPASGVSPEIHMTSATPTAFQTENIGVTVEVDPVIGQYEDIVFVNISPRRVLKLEDRYYTRPDATEPAWGVEHVHMPEFYEMTIQTNFKTIPGHYSLLGFHTPHDQPDRRILCLLKVDLSH